MKKVLIILALSTSFVAVGQQKTSKVYEYTYGVRNPLPTKEIVVDKENNKVEVYQTNYGVREISPSTVIIDNKVYEVNYGVQNPFSKAVIEEEDDQ